MTQKAIVTGASIAGLTTAYWLARAGWEVEVVERAIQFREGGQNVDVRGAAHKVISLMGLTEKVLEKNTTEEGTVFLGRGGRELGRIPVDAEQDGPTAEQEILRGDLARIILDALPAEVSVRYDDSVVAVSDSSDQVEVEFASGGVDIVDLLVVAEGVRSSTRAMVFADAVHARELGMNMVYGTIPRLPSDDNWWRWYTTTRRRGITLRPDAVGSIRATLAYVDHEHDLGELALDEATASLVDTFHGAGWEADRITRAFRDSDDVYVDYLTQIRMPTWSRGRVVLTGDAAWCVTPLGGGGTSLALIGGYVLAAYASRVDANGTILLGEYERWMRPLIDEAQQLPPGTPDSFYPDGRARLAVYRLIQRVMTSPPLRRVLAARSHVARTDQELPDFEGALS